MGKRLSRTSWVLSQVTTLACAVGTCFEYVRWKHSTRHDASVEAKLFLGTSICFLLLFLVRLVYRGFPSKRDYFAEEMEHRRSLAKTPR